MAASGDYVEPRRLGVLDGLRGIAVLLVLWYHVWEISFLPAPVSWLQFVPETGFIGVTLFFYLSGFVIAYPFVREWLAGGPPQPWREFAWRRFIKIVPSYVLFIIVAYAIGFAQQQPGASAPADIVSHLLFVHTWFPQTYGTISGVLWTLGVEVEFYCIFPLVWWCFKRNPWLTTAGAVLIAGVWRAWLAHCCIHTWFAEYSENMPGYLDIFLFGSISAYAYVRFTTMRTHAAGRIAGVAAAIAGAVWVVCLLQSLYAYREFDLWSAVWQIDRRPLLGAAFSLLALGFLWAPRWWQLLLDNPPLRFLATISYNLYLYHQMIARELLAWKIPPYVSPAQFDPAWQPQFTAVAFASTIAQATFVTYVVERPLLRVRPPWSRRPASGALQSECTPNGSAEAASSKSPSQSGSWPLPPGRR
ncbi:MAG TPA: acyltransferase [Candidatus Tumulicola sp.]